MEEAIKVMENSVHENRGDGKVTPLVGAVLVKPDGNVDTASRGELREGDHAEFTVIERKNGGDKLDGSILFATLEPCAPGARKIPKTSCAKRIVNARIKEVWVGIEDPDPTVARKGIKFLEDNGVKVEMFDPDLQKQIEKANREFLDQALERAEEAEKEDKLPTLSSIEAAIPDGDLSDFSGKAIQKYLDNSKKDFKLDSPELYRHFSRLGVLNKVDDTDKKLKPSGVGLILFGNEPQDLFPNTTVIGKVKYGNDDAIPARFEGPLVSMIDDIEQWLRKSLHSKVSREEFERSDEPVYPIKPLREAVINALAHRDYDDKASKVRIEIDDDKILVMSPGLPVSPITLEEVQRFEASSLSRNPQITRVFLKMKYMEEARLGMDTFKELKEKYNLPSPIITYDAPYLTVIFPRSQEAFVEAIGLGGLDQLNKEELAGFQFIKRKGEISKQDYINEFGINDKKAQRHLKKMLDLRLIKTTGRTTAKRYYFEAK